MSSLIDDSQKISVTTKSLTESLYDTKKKSFSNKQLEVFILI